MAHSLFRRILTIALLVSTCGSTAVAEDLPPATDPDAGATPSEILRAGDDLADAGDFEAALERWKEAYVRKLPRWRGLEFREPLRVEYMTESDLGAYLARTLDRELPPEDIEAANLALVHFGFCPPGFDLAVTMLELMTSEIAGFYDPDTKRLYLIARSIEADTKKKSFFDRLFGSDSTFDPEEEKAVLVHEMAHALADQHFDLHSTGESLRSDDDMSLAYAALVEGEAMLVMLMGASDVPDPREFLEGAPVIGIAMAMTMNLGAAFAGGSAFRRAPLILRETLIFPYVSGFTFCAELGRNGTWSRIDAAFRVPPLSTEQILHPEKYLPETRDDPVAFSYPSPPPLDPNEWRLAEENCLGELGIEILFRPKLHRPRSGTAAAGWDGDSYRIYAKGAPLDESVDGAGDAGEATPEGEPEPPRTLLLWTTEWDTPGDASQFADALVTLYAGDRSVVSRGDGDRRWREQGVESVVLRRERRVVFVDRADTKDVDSLLAWTMSAKTIAKTLLLEVHERRGEPQRPDGESDAELEERDDDS